ncbi:hypothetical protein [Streptomyces sp. NBC_00582]|uniref:hypothetical protein n=1 Tax=Streptomyces sp. NBC_00582 TaxID=2975783 RepID=UPI002E800F09|nr:hypothetical protein [Streptomyces sp. NBC_00582]WUB64655.1 hypothetical protein OG852_31755 [Streptomyces sp. NBC_00582]
MTNPAVPVDGPYRITVEPIPTGVTLDVEPFVQRVVTDVIEKLLTDAFADRLTALYDMQARDPHLIERPQDLPFEGLVDDVTAVVRTRLPVYGLQALRLAGRIEQLATPAISALQSAPEGSAAA